MRYKRMIKTAFLAPALMAPVTATAKKPEKPNIIFILTDQWRKQALGFKGEDPVITPNIDKFAQWAVSFDNATSARPVSGPDRACLLTGKYPINNGVFANNVPLDTNEKSMGVLFKEAGYKTGYIGKWHLNGLGDITTKPEQQHGFDLWIQSLGHAPFSQAYIYQDKNEKKIVRGKWAPTYETEEGIKFIEENKKEPFCLVLSYNPPHTSGGAQFEDRWQPGKRVNGKIKYGYGYGGPKEYEAMYGNDYDKNPVRGNIMPTRKFNDLSGFCVPGYFGAITAIDNDFGNLMSYLEKNALLKNTIIVFTADHGESLGSQGLMTKGTWFEESLGVPMLIGWKGKISPKREKCVFNAIDVLPTLLGLSGIEKPDGIDGTDYTPLLFNKRFKAPEYAFCSFDFGGMGEIDSPRYWRSVYTQRYTYVLCGMNQNRAFTKEGIVLYDKEKDPLQLNPIYKGMGYDKEIERLHKVLVNHLKETNDPFIEKYWNNSSPGLPLLNKYTVNYDELLNKPSQKMAKRKSIKQD